MGASFDSRAESSSTHATVCSQCTAIVRLSGRLMIGEVLDCSACGAPLEVARVDPPRLVPFARIEEEPEDFAGFELL